MLTVVASLKGGSGKSTVTFNLGVWLAMAGVKVKTFDLDPQATLSDVVEVRQDEHFKPPVKVPGDIRQLRKWLEQRSQADQDTEVLVDVGTADMDSLQQALVHADRVLIPVQPSQADIWSVQRFLKILNKALNEAGRGKHKPEVYAFINRGDTHHAVRETDEAAAALVSLPGIQFLRARLCQRTAFRRSFSEGLAVFEMDSRGKAAREILGLAAATYGHVLK